MGVLPPRPAPPLTCSRARWPPVCARRGGTTASAAAGAPPALCGCGGGDSSDTQPHRRPPALYPPPPPQGPTCALCAAAASPPHPGSPPCPPLPSPPAAQHPPPARGHRWVPPPSAATPGSGEGGGTYEGWGGLQSHSPPPRSALTPICARSSTCPPPVSGSHVSRVSASAASSWDRGRLRAPSACPPPSCTWGGNGQQDVGRPHRAVPHREPPPPS